MSNKLEGIGLYENKLKSMIDTHDDRRNQNPAKQY